LSADLVLVLDDYHLVETPEVHQGMTFLLEHSPPRLHLVLATRVDPPLPVARLRARGQLVEVRAADLRFTAEESAAYLNGPMGLGLSQADVTALDGRTEGWIAALQLAALSMQGRDDASAFIAGFAGDDRYIVDYLAEEILARQRPEARDFLLETSVLERLTGPLCDAVTGRGGGKATLAALERANLFLIPLDDRREWYRYHHLFADVLRAHLLDERGDDVAELHRRASGWFAANSDASQAIGHALAGGDFDRAAELMELAMPVMRRERRETERARWLRALPDEVVRARPVLALNYIGALAQVSDFDAVGGRLSDLENSVRSADGSWPERPPPGLIVVDETVYRSLPAGVELYRAALALAHGDLDGTVAHAQQSLSLAPADDDHTRAAAGALAGLASWTTGDLAYAHAAYTETVNGLARDGSFADVLGCCITLGDIRRTQGRLHDAVRTYRWALELAPSEPAGESLRGTADMHVAIAEILLERDDRLAAAQHLALSERLGEHIGLPQNPYRWRLSRPGCARPRATSTARSRCSTRLIGSTRATTPRTCGRFPPSGHGCSCVEANWATPRRGPATGSCPPTTNRPICASTSTSRSPGCCWPGTASSATTLRCIRRLPCSTGSWLRPRTAAGAAARSSCWCCWRSASKAERTCRPHSRRCSAPSPAHSRRGTCACSPTKDRQWRLC
jgi:LuxR family maltose regulon positive regulatory protein